MTVVFLGSLRPNPIGSAWEGFYTDACGQGWQHGVPPPTHTLVSSGNGVMHRLSSLCKLRPL